MLPVILDQPDLLVLQERRALLALLVLKGILFSTEPSIQPQKVSMATFISIPQVIQFLVPRPQVSGVLVLL